MKFKLLGFLPPFLGKAFSGSQAPAPSLHEDRIRVWFSSRNSANMSYPFYYDVSVKDPLKVLVESHSFIDGFPYGLPGEPDSDGIMVSKVEEEFFYYTGINRGDEIARYRTSCMKYNLSTREKFVISDRLTDARCGTSMPFPFKDSTYYAAFHYWDSNAEPHYSIYQRDKTGKTYEIITEIAARPTAINLDGKDYIFYSKRGPTHYRTDPNESYRIRVQIDTVVDETVNIDGDPNHMQCYGNLVQVDNKVYMFYNSGSMTGQIGVAEWTQ